MAEEVKKITLQQKQCLIDFMDINYKFLFGKFSNVKGKASKEQKWKELCESLNMLGPPKKGVDKWKKVRYNCFKCRLLFFSMN